MNHNHLYFIVIDSNDNVFGHYHPGVIDKIFYPQNYDSNIFVFTLNSNGRSGVRRFYRQYGGVYAGTVIFDDNDYYKCHNDWYKRHSGYSIRQIDTNSSCIGNNIVYCLEGIEYTTSTGNHYPDKFTTRRVIVIEMK